MPGIGTTNGHPEPIHGGLPRRNWRLGDDDHDSDMEELQGDLDRFDQSLRELYDRPLPSPRREGSRRGHRSAIEPRGDIKARLSKVNQAFMLGDYATAIEMVFEVIRINAETVQAWNTLGSIFREQGDHTKALMAMGYAAHLQPKDSAGWLQCADFALSVATGDDEDGRLSTARLCYSAALKADPKLDAARLGKATVCHRQGHMAAAIADYSVVLQHQARLDLDVVRKLAEACVESASAGPSVPTAVSAYQRYLSQAAGINFGPSEESEQGPRRQEDLYQGVGDPESLARLTWHDASTYAELFASVGQFADAIKGLKFLARLVVGRQEDTLWALWDSDDREWDAGEERRLEVPDFCPVNFDKRLYGDSLPLELRARLASYRLALHDSNEALRHLSWLPPGLPQTDALATRFPFLILDIADRLAEHHDLVLARDFYSMLLNLGSGQDPALLLRIGKCHASEGDAVTAEELFLAVIEGDCANVEARVELAGLYEAAREDEEALILATEAMLLEETRGTDTDSEPYSGTRLGGIDPRRRGLLSRAILSKKSGRRAAPGILRRRYRPRRLANPESRRKEEESIAANLTAQWKLACHLKSQIHAGQHHLKEKWAELAKNLVDEFRSLRQFYSWDRYLKFLGALAVPSPDGVVSAKQQQQGTPLSLMVERLSRNLAPPQPTASTGSGSQPGDVSSRDDYIGIPFSDWLTLFLDYAVALAVSGKREESYLVCEAARDCVAFKTASHSFLIHVASCACALLSQDEERCISVAREFMRDCSSMSDPTRMFSLLCRLCQAPISWYASGPTQKYILRQIRAIDSSHLQSATTAPRADPKLDICLLMLYGHILYTSSSYTFALNYFLRALALDPTNPMISFSVGLGYIHYALKRQSSNRQYLITQGLSFVFRYFHVKFNSDDATERQAACFDVARTFQLLGLHDIADRYYQQWRSISSPQGEATKMAELDLALYATFNQWCALVTGGNLVASNQVLRQSLRL